MGKSSWYGSKKKKGRERDYCSEKTVQFDPNSRNNIVRFINKPLSNIDLLQWIKQLGIKYFRGIYSRDNLPDKIHKLETGVINLDDSMGGGSHWVCYRNVDKQYCEYFDPFGLIISNEIKNDLKTSGKKVVYSSDEIQERDSVFVRLLVLILSPGETEREIIIRRYTSVSYTHLTLPTKRIV